MWERQSEITKAQAELGWNDNVRFYGWFDDGKNAPFRLTTAEAPVQCYVSSYQAPKGWLLVIFNDGAKSQNTVVMCPPGTNVGVDLVTGKQFVSAENQIAIEIPGKSSRIIVFKN